MLPVVKKAEKMLLAQLEANEINHEYLPIGGLNEFVRGAQRFALGDDHAAIAAGRVRCVFLFFLFFLFFYFFG